MAEESEEVQNVLNAIASLEEIADDATCARAVTELLNQWPQQHAELRELRQRRVVALKAEGRTWQEIGDLLGVHFTRARQIAQGQRGDKNRPTKRAAETDTPE